MSDLKLNSVCRELFTVTFAKESNDPCQTWGTLEPDKGVASICQKADGSLHARFTRRNNPDLEATYDAEHGGYTDGKWADRDTLRGLELLVLKQYGQLNFVLGSPYGGSPDDRASALKPSQSFTAVSFEEFYNNIHTQLPKHGYMPVGCEQEAGLIWLEWLDNEGSVSVYRHALGHGADCVHFERAWTRAILWQLYFMVLG